MPDILLIQPPIADFYRTAKRSLPYGLACIAAALRRRGFDVALLDALATPKSRILAWPEEMAFLAPFFGRPDLSPLALFHHYRHFGYSYEHIARQARAADPFLIGISSLFSAYSDTALRTAAAVKQVCPRAVIVLGGHHPTALPETVLLHPAVDYLIRGDGEAALPRLAEALRGGSSPEGIAGVCGRRADGTFYLSPPTAPDHLGQLPPPALDLIEWGYYRRRGRAALAISAGRGCPWRCTYCAVNAATFHGFRRRDVAAVLSEIDAAHAAHPLGFIDFEDEHLSADRAWFMELLTALAGRFGPRPPELRAMNGLFAPSLDEQIIDAMQAAGFKTLNLALITTHAGQLRRFGRPDITAAVDRVVYAATQRGLDCVVYIIVAGPGQEPAQAIADLLFLAQRPVLAGLSVFYPAPGSADYGWCRKMGLLPERPSLLRATALPLVHKTDRVQAVTLLRLGRVLNFMKQLMDSGQGLPAPASVPSHIDAGMDPLTVGRVLIAAFLKEGTIFGVDDQRRTYPHLVDKTLTRAFLNGLQSIRLRGTGKQMVGQFER
jgi:hypothetical protein